MNNQLKTALETAENQLIKQFRSKRVSEALRKHCVYHIQRVDGSNIILNRHYKPTGILSDNIVEYRDFVDTHSITLPAEFPRHLFNDGCPPWANKKCLTEYIEKLRTLCSQQVP